MAIRLIRERKTESGSLEHSVEEFAGSAIVIGRGSDSDLILSGNLIALRHARIATVDEGFTIEAIDSLTGVRVNGKLVQRQVLASGDRIAIADYAFRVEETAPALVLVEVAAPSINVADDSAATLARALDIRHVLPPLRLVSLGAILIVLLIGALYPLLSGDRRPWESGPVTNHHRMIEQDCGSCHEGGFQQIPDRKCLACHTLSDHAPLFRHANISAALSKDCISCHQEHNNEKALLPKESKLCLDCHAQPQLFGSEVEIAAVKNWDAHPEFSVLLPGMTPPKKVRLDASNELADQSHLKLNHALHLKPDLRGAGGPVTLQCRDCHELAEDLRSFKPIRMERHCKSCHALTFDERIPSEVPHADPNVVYKYLYAEYAKLMLEPESAAGDEMRLRPGQGQKAAGAEAAFVRTEVEERARAAERELFTRTACKLCHEISEAESNARNAQESRYAVLTPEIPADWMPAARFDHGAHEELSCTSCHAGAPKSEQTADVLMPQKAVCMECHAQNAHAGKVGSDCISCHSFHDALPLDWSLKKDWQEGRFLGNRTEMIGDRIR